MLKVNQNEKALFRKGAKVTCDYYPGTVFYVVGKSWGMYGELTYTIQRTVSSDKFDNFPAIPGLRSKYINKA